MEAIKKGTLNKVIDSAYIIRLDTGKKQTLSTKGDSSCHFFKPVIIDKYRVIFRIHWSEIDKNGHPILDADFYNDKNKQLSNKGCRGKAHHTKANAPNRAYEWEFKNTEIPFKLIVCWAKFSGETTHFSDDSYCEVLRNGKKL